MRKPSAANQVAFDDAVRDIAEVTERLLSQLSVRTTPARSHSA
jgi:hypothetical protein